MQAHVDHNPDRDGWKDYKYMVHRAVKDPTLTHVPTSKGNLKFNKDGRMFVRDITLANEIRQSELGQRADVCVSRMVDSHPSDRGHRYMFGQMPAMPWHKCGVCGQPNSVCQGIHNTPSEREQAEAETAGE